MSQPTDRLGQPLSVGDWVVFRDCITPNPDDGARYQLVGFASCKIALLDSGEKCFTASLTKINPKKQTTTWDKCVWQPEGWLPNRPTQHA